MFSGNKNIKTVGLTTSQHLKRTLNDVIYISTKSKKNLREIKITF